MKKLNSFIIIIAGLRHDMEKSVATLDGQCFEFPATSATVGDMLDWFRMEVQALSIAFTKSNQNITCYAVAGILRMLAGVETGICQSFRNWLYPVMLRFCMTSLRALGG
jgi:hypothetical protein